MPEESHLNPLLDFISKVLMYGIPSGEGVTIDIITEGSTDTFEKTFNRKDVERAARGLEFLNTFVGFQKAE